MRFVQRVQELKEQKAGNGNKPRKVKNAKRNESKEQVQMWWEKKAAEEVISIVDFFRK